MTKDEILDKIQQLKDEAEELKSEIETAEYNMRAFPYSKVKAQSIDTINECTNQLKAINKEFKKLFKELESN